MAKPSQSRQLDEAVQALLARRGADAEPAIARVASRLAALVRIAADLRDLPRQDFKVRLKADIERRAIMATKPMTTGKTKPVPEGYQTATPYLIFKDAAAAIEFYKKVFGATESMRIRQPDGRIGHAEIKIGNARIMLADEFPEIGARSPQAFGGSPVFMHLYVEDVDTVAREAVAVGAKLLRPVKDQFYGDRSGTLADPFGYQWTIATHIEDVSVQEIERRAAAAMSRQARSVEEKQQGPKPVKSIREGFHTVTPYLLVELAAELVDFVKQAFGATELFRGTGSAGGLHSEVRIEDSILMVGGHSGMKEMPTALHLYVEDADSVYQRALQAGATSTGDPVDQPYGDREAGVKDPFGNHWFIATHKLTGKHIPEGLRTVTPYLHPRGAGKLIDFLKQALGAEEAARHEGPDGAIHHAVVRIGDSMIEMGEAHGPWQPMPTTFYLYVEDADTLYKRAIQAGAVSISEPADQPYGDRNAGVKDRWDNVWYIATHIRD